MLLHTALVALGAQIERVQPAPGWRVVVVLLGVLIAAVVVVVGHAFWVWRRKQGALRSADDAVRDLAASHRDSAGERREQSA